MTPRKHANATDYPWIRVWGKMMGSAAYYIESEVEKAREAKAPELAVYERSVAGGGRSGEWVTLDEVTNISTLIRLQTIAGDAGIEWPETVHPL